MIPCRAERPYITRKNMGVALTLPSPGGSRSVDRVQSAIIVWGPRFQGRAWVETSQLETAHEHLAKLF